MSPLGEREERESDLYGFNNHELADKFLLRKNFHRITVWIVRLFWNGNQMDEMVSKDNNCCLIDFSFWIIEHWISIFLLWFIFIENLNYLIKKDNYLITGIEINLYTYERNTILYTVNLCTLCIFVIHRKIVLFY